MYQLGGPLSGWCQLTLTVYSYLILPPFPPFRSQPPSRSSPASVAPPSVPLLHTATSPPLRHLTCPPPPLPPSGNRLVLDSRITNDHWLFPFQHFLHPVMAGASKCLAFRFYQLKTGHCLAGQYLQWRDDQSPGREVLVVPIQHPDPRTPVQKLPSAAIPAENPLVSRLRIDQEAPGPTQGRGRTKIAVLLADKWCSQAVKCFS